MTDFLFIYKCFVLCGWIERKLGSALESVLLWWGGWWKIPWNVTVKWITPVFVDLTLVVFPGSAYLTYEQIKLLVNDGFCTIILVNDVFL